jgi:3-dehydroquinate dehydratase II
MPSSILLVNGPNLNTLGSREPHIYGHETLKDIEDKCKKTAKSLGLTLECFQSNHEGDIIDKIQEAVKKHKGVIINGGAFTHTSVAIMDALLLIKGPVIEVHISNLFTRESFRHESYISKAATGMICGLGSTGYLLALTAMAERLGKKSK